MMFKIIILLGDNMNQVTYAFLITTLAGLTTMIGSLLIFYKKTVLPVQERTVSFACFDYYIV